MRKVIFCTNLPSPYRVDFFNELGKYCDLTVLYERHNSAERNAAWKGTDAKNFKEVYLALQLVGVDRSKGSALKNYIKDHESEFLIFTNYVSPATMQAIVWFRLHGRQYYIEYDGGFNKKDTLLKSVLKKFLLKGAIGHLTTADEHIRYLKSLGIADARIYKYPFTSISEQDIVDANVLTFDGRTYFKRKLGIKETKVVLSVGLFLHEEKYTDDYGVLMHFAESLDSSVGIYVVVEHAQNLPLDCNKVSVGNIHFIVAEGNNNLSEFYAAADLFTILSCGEGCGQVLNEAMAYGLPIISSNQCIAGTELVDNGENGYILDLEDFNAMKKCFTELIHDDVRLSSLGKCSYIKTVCNFSQMAEIHNPFSLAARKSIKEFAKYVLNISEDKVIISVGRFIYKKGFDVLLKAAKFMQKDTGIYIIGGEPTDDYIQMKRMHCLENVHFIGFKTKSELSLYYQAADCVAFPTREDIWGLITNEALAFGVPVVATDRCVSALEMIKNGKNGYIVSVGDDSALAHKIQSALLLGAYTDCISTAMKFTIENMAKAHMEIFENKKDRKVF